MEKKVAKEKSPKVAAAPAKAEAPAKAVAEKKPVVEKKVAAPRSPVRQWSISRLRLLRSSLRSFHPRRLPLHSGDLATPGSNGSHSQSFIQKQRQRLLDLRDELVDAVSGMARDTIRNAPEGSEASGSGQHQGDAGSDAYDRDFALSVLAKEQDALYEIEQALRRIQAGAYGICEMSSRKIPQARLEAIPFARLTVECQSQWEKEYGNRRFRPSNEVGFSGGKYVDDEESETVSLDEDDD